MRHLVWYCMVFLKKDCKWWSSDIVIIILITSSLRFSVTWLLLEKGNGKKLNHSNWEDYENMFNSNMIFNTYFTYYMSIKHSNLIKVIHTLHVMYWTSVGLSMDNVKVGQRFLFVITFKKNGACHTFGFNMTLELILTCWAWKE